MADRPDITPELLRQLVRYEPDTGKLFWLFREPHHFPNPKNAMRWNVRYAGREAFCAVTKEGYRRGVVRKVNLFAHRVAWAIYYGAWPLGEIDHINGQPADNRIHNLRDVDHKTNQRNLKIPRHNRSGFIGVKRVRGKWQARINVDGREHAVRGLETRLDAQKARKELEQKFGFHANHGSR